MGFDVENFGLGLLAGWGTAYGVYRARHLIGSTMRSVTQGASNVQTYTLQNADSRYVNDVVQMAEHSHLGGRFVKLSDILVEPRFTTLPPLAAPPDDEVLQDVFSVVPFVPDYPYLGAPYNRETLSIDDLATGERGLALLGLPGSGRTTALMSIALRSLGKIKFREPIDKVQQRIEAEDAALNEKQRAVRIKERLTIEQRAKERLAEEQGMAFDADADAQTKAALPLFNRLMPVYIHLADVSVGEAEFGKEIDPAEPLIRAVQRQVGRVTASTIPRNLYNRLGRGQVLLLVDGYDDLPENERERQLAWLDALMAAYTNNFFIVTGSAIGYGMLTQLGLTPVFLRPFSDNRIKEVVDNWRSVWPQMSASRRQPNIKPDDEAVNRALTNNRALSPYELTLKIWANFANDADIPGIEGWLRAYLNRHLPSDQSITSLLPQMAQAAALQLDEGYITQTRLEQIVSGQISTKAISPSIAELRAEAETDEEAEDGEKEKESASAQGKLLALLRRSGLLIRYTGERYQLRHSLLAAYLASLTLQGTSQALVERTSTSSWENAVAYAGLHIPMDDLVRARLNAPLDVLANRTLEIARWLPYTSGDAAWKGGYLKYLGNLFLSPSQFPLIRERAAAALVGTRERNVLFVFRQGARNASAELRRLSCLGMGALGDAEAVNDLEPLLRDQENDVQLAAAIALGAIRTEEALNALVEALTEGSEQLRRVAAETFADIPEEGYPVLYDAIQDEEMMLRRAAVFGLRRVKSPWALIAIYRAFLEDEQWYVRSAAQLAFQEQQYGGEHGPRSYPPAEGINWLNDWAAKRGENVPPGEGANQMLLKVLQEGEPNLRTYAATVLGQLGLTTTARPLYAALRDRQAEVRDAAHRALADLQMQIGEPLPVPH